MGIISIGTEGTFYKSNVVEPIEPYTITISASGQIHDVDAPQYSIKIDGSIIIDIDDLGTGARPFLQYDDDGDGFSVRLVMPSNASYVQRGFWRVSVNDAEWEDVTDNRIGSSRSGGSYGGRTGAYGFYAENVAIFRPDQPNKTTLGQWINAGSNLTDELIENVYNYSGEGSIPDDTTNYYIYNTFASGIGSFEGFNKTGSDTIRNQNIYTRGTSNVALYYNATDNSLNLVANQDNIYQAYHNDGTSSSDDGRNIYYRTFYNYWQNATGQTIGASRVDTNIPIFTTQSQALDYLNGLIDESTAINFDDVSGGINPQNKTGIQEINTIFSDTYHTGVFGQQFACGISALREIANTLYSTDDTIIEGIKKGLYQYSNPIDSIIDLSYYPFDVTSLLHNTVPQSYVNFGAYRVELNNSINRIVYSNGYIDCGATPFYPTYKNFIDYEHTAIEVWLPYIGMKSLDPVKYMGHTIHVRYYIDFHTRGCTCCILADDLLVDTFEGIIGICQPISAINYTDFANSTINTLVGGANGVIGGVTSGLTGGYGGAVSGAIGIDTALMQTATSLATNKAINHAQTKGNVGADTGGHLPQYVFFRFTYETPIEPKNLIAMYGKPSNQSGRLSSFGGFLQCNVVDLECGRATESEKNEIISLLKLGIRI